jgi:hypothetical protein
MGNGVAMKDPQASIRIAMDPHLRLDVVAAVPVRRDLQHQALKADAIGVAHRALKLLAENVVQRATEAGDKGRAFLLDEEHGVARIVSVIHGHPEVPELPRHPLVATSILMQHQAGPRRACSTRAMLAFPGGFGRQPGFLQWVSRLACQPLYASSNRIFRVSCSHSVRLMSSHLLTDYETGQITCYKPGQFICSLHSTSVPLTLGHVARRILALMGD